MAELDLDRRKELTETSSYLDGVQNLEDNDSWTTPDRGFCADTRGSVGKRRPMIRTSQQEERGNKETVTG